MPFKSDAQRRYLWSQKPEVAKKFAQHHNDGGWVDTWTQRLKHADPVSEPGTVRNFLQTAWDMMQKNKAAEAETPEMQAIQQMQKYEPPKPQSRWSADWNIPIGHALGADWNTYGSYQDMDVGSDNWNAGIKGTWRFAEGGDVPMMDDRQPKKVTKKDRYGNQVTVEYESEVKPIDQTEIIKEMMQNMGDVPEMDMQVPMMDHPGEPKGTDTVPAWLTPGEFVVNKEATDIYGPIIKEMNDHGRQVQMQKKGGSIQGDDTMADPNDPSQHLFLGGAARFLTNPWVVSAGTFGFTKAYDRLFGDDPEKVMVPTFPPSYAEAYKEMPEAATSAELVDPSGHKKDWSLRNILLGSGDNLTLPSARKIQANLHATKPKLYNEGGWVTDELLDRLAQVESGGDNSAVSKAGAVGKYQWLPSSAKQAGYGVKAFDPLNEEAARAATKQYLMNMQKHHGFTPEETLRAYNWGPGNVLKHKAGKRKDIPAEALNYPGKILGVENIEGVDVPYDMPVPTARPFQNGGPIPHFDTLASEYQKPEGHTIHPEIKTGGHQMFGGNQNLAGEPVVQGPAEKEIPWYAPLLGHKSKAALDIPLNENEQRLQQEAGKFDSAINPSLVGDDPVGEGYATEDIEGTGMKTDAEKEVAGENAIVDDMDPKHHKDFKEEVKNETVKKIDDLAKKDPNATGPGSDQKGNNASEEELENAAKEDPSLVDKAGGFLKSAFGDLFDGKELARAAILYAGSRALGYSHSGSMQYIAKNYLTRVDAKAQAKIDAAATKDKRAFELAKTDKFTPGSVAAYKKSGNPADLVSKKSVAGAVPTGVTEQRLVNGKKVSVQQVKLPDGSIGYNIPGKGNVTKAALENATKPYEAAFDKGTPEYRARRSRAVKDNTDLFKEIQLREGRYKEGDEYKYRTGIIPSQAAHDFWTFSESYGIDPESDEAKDLMGAAYRQAIAQSSIKGAPVAKNLKPFLEAAYIRQQTGAPELFQVNPDKDAKETEKYVRSDKMQQLTSVLDSIGQRVLPKSTKTDARNQIINSLVSDWGNLSDKDKKQWNRKANKGIETGFYLYAKDKADKYLIDNKLGE